MWFLAAGFVLVVFPGLLGAVGVAQSGTSTAGRSGVAVLGFMDVRDSSGVRLTDYIFATRHGGLSDPLVTVVSMVLGLEFVGYLVLVTSAVWVIGYALSFGWLDPFGRALTGVADALTGQIATPLILMTAVAIGAFFVAWFIVRGQSAKATTQVVTMIGVALFGPIFLAEPLGDVLSAHGLLAQGRDLGISVAAGLNGNNNPNPAQLVATMQEDLADNFARRPVQVWNFGHVIDQSPRCAAAWSAAVRTGDDDRVINSMRACGDTAAYDEADNPSMAQIGSGLVLLLCGTILLLFGIYLAIKIMWAALDAVYHGFMTIFGFAAGGFVYGPTQTFLVRNLVDSFIAAARMAVYTIFLGVYVLFLGNLFHQAQDQVGVVLVLGAFVEIIALLQLRRLSAGLVRGNEWIANRFALAIQSGGMNQGSGGGMALGMGNAGAGNSMSPLGVLAAASTINNSPITGWLAGRNNPLSRLSWLDHLDKKNKAKGLATRDLREAVHGVLYDRVSLAEVARKGIAESGARRGSQLAAAFAAEYVTHDAGGTAGVDYALKMAGVPVKRRAPAKMAQVDIERHVDKEALASKHIGRVLAATKYFERDYLVPELADARLSALMANVNRYRYEYSNPVTISKRLESLGKSYLDRPTKEFIDNLQKAADGVPDVLVDGWSLSQTAADRLRDWMAYEHPRRVQAAANWVAENPTEFERIRRLRSEVDKAAQTDQWQNGRNITGNTSLPQPDTVLHPLLPIPKEFWP
ncbi:hypothetical protein [Nocardia pneumoniae]|uniref:hypothetical protein n=1 Tax=Nocardia pneumoniae TaxID=228601 RepID=UPI0012F6F4DA|nr:hypothetical protein [Nocardia pneumoniae]